MKRRGDPLVYTSGRGRICSDCGRPVARCTCTKRPRVELGDGVVRVRREVKGRREKTVVTISGLALPRAELDTLATELKRRCGTGGSAKDGVIEIQGDHRDELVEALRERGYTVKLAGG